MANYGIKADPGLINLSPHGFHILAKHFYKAKQDFISPERFSPIPYFLLARSIELQLKALHLIEKRQDEVKNKYWHRLIDLYNDLNENHKILNEDERQLLLVTNALYNPKKFEYFNVYMALRGYKDYPNLEELDQLTKKLLAIEAESLGFKNPQSSLVCRFWQRLNDIASNRLRNSIQSNLTK